MQKDNKAMRFFSIFVLLVLFSPCFTPSSSNFAVPPKKYSLQQVPGLSLSSSSVSQSSQPNSFAESSSDKQESDATDHTPGINNSSRRIIQAASELLNESRREDENFITRMRDRCWEPLPRLKFPRRWWLDSFMPLGIIMA